MDVRFVFDLSEKVKSLKLQLNERNDHVVKGSNVQKENKTAELNQRSKRALFRRQGINGRKCSQD